MKVCMKLFFGSVILFFASNLFGQSVYDFVNRINDNYKKLNSMELSLEYNLYWGYDGDKVMDTYTSSFYLKDNCTYRSFFDEEIITVPEMTLVINHNLRVIQITNPLESGLFDQDIEKNLDKCEDILIKEDDGGKRVTLVFKEFSDQKYSRVDVYIDKDYWVKKTVFYLSNQIDFSQDYFNPKKGYGRLEVSYLDLKKKWKDPEGSLKISKYFEVKAGEYIPSTLYKSYEIIDIRK